MFRGLLRYKRLDEEKPAISSLDESRNEEDSPKKPGSLVCSNSTDVSGSAIQLILDNIASPEDIKNIYKKDADLKMNYCSRLKECEFCKKKCDHCKVCCTKKEMQMYLVNHAMKKLSFISLYNDELHFVNKFVSEYPSHMNKLSEMKASCGELSSESMNTKKLLKIIKRRLKNIEKYYPQIYHHKGCIIEKWGNDADLCSMKREIIELNTEITQLFWI